VYTVRGRVDAGALDATSIRVGGEVRVGDHVVARVEPRVRPAGDGTFEITLFGFEGECGFVLFAGRGVPSMSDADSIVLTLQTPDCVHSFSIPLNEDNVVDPDPGSGVIELRNDLTVPEC
jgi:hypothetical protein